MPLKKPSEFYIKNPNTSLDEVKENATPEKVERISEAFNSFKTNFDHIQALTDFTNTFDTFKSNVEKVDTLSESVEDIREGIKDLINKEDLDGAMTAQLLFVEESIRNVQDKVKTLNSKSILDIKTDFDGLTKTVKGFIGEEVPAYKKLIVDSETRVDSRFVTFKEDVKDSIGSLVTTLNDDLAQIGSEIEAINEESLSSVKTEVKGIKGQVESLLEKVLPKYKKFFAETEVRTEEKISANEKLVKETAKEIEEKYESQIKGITEDFDSFINDEIPKYKKLLVDSKLKTEEEVKEISKNLDEQVSKINKNVVNLQQRVNNKDIEIDEVLLEKTATIEKLINKSKDLSRTYDDLSRDFKAKEVQYENTHFMNHIKIEEYKKNRNILFTKDIKKIDILVDTFNITDITNKNNFTFDLKNTYKNIIGFNLVKACVCQKGTQEHFLDIVVPSIPYKACIHNSEGKHIIGRMSMNKTSDNLINEYEPTIIQENYFFPITLNQINIELYHYDTNESSDTTTSIYDKTHHSSFIFRLTILNNLELMK